MQVRTWVGMSNRVSHWNLEFRFDPGTISAFFFSCRFWYGIARAVMVSGELDFKEWSRWVTPVPYSSFGRFVGPEKVEMASGYLCVFRRQQLFLLPHSIFFPRMLKPRINFHLLPDLVVEESIWAPSVRHAGASSNSTRGFILNSDNRPYSEVPHKCQTTGTEPGLGSGLQNTVPHFDRLDSYIAQPLLIFENRAFKLGTKNE